MTPTHCGLKGQHEPTYRQYGNETPRVTCDCAEKLISRAFRMQKALENIRGICDSFCPDHPMPQSTYACGYEATNALASPEEGEK